MFLAEKIKNNTLLPALIVLLVLSIESIIVAMLEFIELSIKLMDSELLPYSDEFLDLVIVTFAKGIGLLVLVLLLTQKLRSSEIKDSPGFKWQNFLGVILLYVGCTTFLMQNLSNSLLIFPFRVPIIKVWPEIILSRLSIDYMGYQFFLILLLLVVMPIFEELLYRKAVIQALLKKRIKFGWILVISSLIYAISPFISNLVMYSEEQAIWDFTIRIFSGLILAITFIKTQKVKYPIFLRFLVNCVIYIQFLTMFHPVLSPFKELYPVSLLILTSIGIIIFFYILFDGITTFWSTSSFPPWLDSLLDFRFSEDVLKPLFSSILFILPLVPFGLIIFIDHTILYGDFEGTLIKTIIKSFFLGILVLVCGIQIITNQLLYEASSEPNASLLLLLKAKYSDIRENYQDIIKKIPRGIIRNFGIIILVLGVLTPIFFFSMGATIFTGVPGLGTIIEVNMNMRSGQNPFWSYSRVEVSSRSPWFWMIPIQRTTEEMFYFLKHTNGLWYFLPDTFMSQPGDWIHGLMTVGTWFLILILLYFTIHEYKRNHKIIAGFAVIGVIGTELLWYLFTMGIGSIPSGGGPPPVSTNQTLSQLIQMDFELSEFLILPLGLIIFLVAAFTFLFSGIRHHLKEKKKISNIQLDGNNSGDIEDSSQVSVKEDELFSKEKQKNAIDSDKT